MNLSKLLLIAGVIVVLLFAYNIYNDRATSPEPVGEIVSGESIVDEIEDLLGRQIEEDIPKTEITDGNAKAVISYNPTNNPPSLSVLADLGESDEEYEVNVSNGEDKQVLGVMQNVKGGYVLETNTTLNLEEYNNIQITTPNETILQGILDL